MKIHLTTQVKSVLDPDRLLSLTLNFDISAPLHVRLAALES